MRSNLLAWVAFAAIVAVTAPAYGTTPANPSAERWAAQKAEEWAERAAHAAVERIEGLSLARAHKLVPDDADRAFAYARWCAQNGHRATAIALLATHGEAHPEYAGLRVYQGRVLAWEERYDEARAVLDAVLLDHPERADAWIARGDVELWRGEALASLAFYERAHELAVYQAPIQARPTVTVAEAEHKRMQAVVATGDEGEILAFLRSVPMREDSSARRAVRTLYERRDAPARVDVGTEYTFADAADWAAVHAGLSTRVHEQLSLGFGARVERRAYDLPQTDVSLRLPVYLRPVRSLELRVEPLATPQADFAPVWQVDGGLAHEPIPRLGYAFGARHSRYTEARASMLYPSLSVSPWRFTFEATWFATFATDADVSHSVRGKWIFHLSDTQRVELWGQVGAEPLEPRLARVLDEPRQVGVLVAATGDLRPLTSLRIHYAYLQSLGDGQAARALGSRHALGLTLTHRFRWRSPYVVRGDVDYVEAR